MSACDQGKLARETRPIEVEHLAERLGVPRYRGVIEDVHFGCAAAALNIRRHVAFDTDEDRRHLTIALVQEFGRGKSGINHDLVASELGDENLHGIRIEIEIGQFLCP